MSRNPRIRIEAYSSTSTTLDGQGEHMHGTPMVRIQIAYDQGDHTRALAELNKAVAETKKKIREGL